MEAKKNLMKIEGIIMLVRERMTFPNAATTTLTILRSQDGKSSQLKHGETLGIEFEILLQCIKRRTFNSEGSRGSCVFFFFPFLFPDILKDMKSQLFPFLLLATGSGEQERGNKKEGGEREASKICTLMDEAFKCGHVVLFVGQFSDVTSCSFSLTSLRPQLGFPSPLKNTEGSFEALFTVSPQPSPASSTGGL